MSFVTGLMLIDAPASALNNRGEPEVAKQYENEVAVKAIYSGGNVYPYVSAQAFRYWLRLTLEKLAPDWKMSPVYRDGKIAYTDANPLDWWDDDLLGYMRAPGSGSKKTRDVDPAYQQLTPLDSKEQALTRVSPFRVSTLVAIAPAHIVKDWESMTRLEGDPIPYVSQFYRATLKGLFSLDLNACGTFSYIDKTGFRNLDDVRKKLAEERGLTHLNDEKSYRLSDEERLRRVTTLFEAMAQLEGGAKQTLHYTDVSPVLTILAVTKGGNHIFGHTIGAKRDTPVLNLNALQEVLTVFEGEILSPVYVGWVKGYLDEERAKLEQALAAGGPLATFAGKVKISHPREAFKSLVEEIQRQENLGWLD
jgi:CRISPR-associated protein Cst2